MLLVASVTAFFILAALVFIQKKGRLLLSLTKEQWVKHALVGLLNPTIYYLILFKAYDLLPAQIAQPFNYSWPIILLVLLSIINRKPIPQMKYIGMACSLGGVVLISLGSDTISGTSLSVVGLFMALLSAALWAVFWIVNNMNKDTDNTVSLLLYFLFGSFYLLIASLFVEVELHSVRGIISGMYVGAFEMAVPFIFFSLALKKTDNPALINQLCYLSPLLSLFIIHFILGEDIYSTTYIGLFLIVSGILFNEYLVKNNLQKRKKTKKRSLTI